LAKEGKLPPKPKTMGKAETERELQKIILEAITEKTPYGAIINELKKYDRRQRNETVAASGYSKTQANLVRPVRSFTSYRLYAIGSTGPAGGKIFIVQP
jgi:hypothetical protein